MKRSLFALATLILGIIIGASFIYKLKEHKMPKVHKLEFPLMLSGGTANSPATILPKGTSLYYDQAFPEGFVRYMVYINVEGVKLEPRESTEKFWLDPLTAIPFDKDSLRKLLATYPLSKDDLSAILGSGQISKEEIRDLLREYSE
ncbi:hypothetical protein [Cupriavidus taiwanensis]|uniref:hypothetical protein n=1 Tax=Cupriavidus taiwanensis TaxID=164546 RepID=UPI000E2F0B84